MRNYLAITKALSDETRVRALMCLVGGELCVCQLIDVLGLSPSTVSKHMSILQQAGLVERRKDGRWHYYDLAGEDAPPVVRQALQWTLRSLEHEKDHRRRRRGAVLRPGEGPQGAHRMLQPKLKVLFLCTGNSCRSQMAEGWARQLKAQTIEPYSAGLAAHGLNPHAVQVMREAGVDITEQTSKTLDSLADVEFDTETNDTPWRSNVSMMRAKSISDRLRRSTL